MAWPFFAEVNAVYSVSATWASETQHPSWSSQIARLADLGPGRLTDGGDGRGDLGVYVHRLLSAEQPPQSPGQWERWWLHVTRRALAASYLTHHGRPGPPDGDQTRLVHSSCHRWPQARQSRKPAFQPATSSRLA